MNILDFDYAVTAVKYDNDKRYVSSIEIWDVVYHNEKIRDRVVDLSKRRHISRQELINLIKENKKVVAVNSKISNMSNIKEKANKYKGTDILSLDIKRINEVNYITIKINNIAKDNLDSLPLLSVK